MKFPYSIDIPKRRFKMVNYIYIAREESPQQLGTKQAKPKCI